MKYGSRLPGANARAKKRYALSSIDKNIVLFNRFNISRGRVTLQHTMQHMFLLAQPMLLTLSRTHTPARAVRVGAQNPGFRDGKLEHTPSAPPRHVSPKIFRRDLFFSFSCAAPLCARLRACVRACGHVCVILSTDVTRSTTLPAQQETTHGRAWILPGIEHQHMQQQQPMKNLVVGGAVVAPRNPPAEKLLRATPWRPGLGENALEATVPILVAEIAAAVAGAWRLGPIFKPTAAQMEMLRNVRTISVLVSLLRQVARNQGRKVFAEKVAGHMLAAGKTE